MIRFISILCFFAAAIFCLNVLFIVPSLTNDYALNTVVVICNLGISIIIAAVISFNRIFFIMLSIILLLIGGLLSFFQIFFGIYFNENLLISCLEANYEEVSSFFSIDLIGWLLLTFLLPTIILIKKSNWLKINIKRKIIIMFLSSIVGALIFYSPILSVKSINPILLIRDIARQNFPINLIVATIDVLNYKEFQSEQNKIDIFANHNFKFKDRGVKVVLVIGESARSDRFDFKKYERNLIPNLQREKNLVNFRNAFSLGTHTIATVPRLLKVFPEMNENSIISLYKKLGFTTTWISSQPYNSIINRIASESDEFISMEDILRKTKYDKVGRLKDGDLVNILHNSVQDNNDNQLIILHTMGSHRPYDDRYTEEYKKFIPVCSSDNEKSFIRRVFKRNKCYDIEEFRNSYDNTILYTDYVLKTVIDELRLYKSMLIYISDHGESLGENGVFLHGYNYNDAPKEQLHIPYVLWYSNKLLENDPQIVKNLAIAENNREHKVTQSTVFHSLLDCINVKSDFINKEKSICSKSLQ